MRASPQPTLRPPPDEPAPARTTGRCHACGYSLAGIPAVGRCPECGSRYTPESAGRLKPRPQMLSLIVRFSWPFGALAVAFVLALLLVLDETDPMVLVLGLPCAVAFPVNTCLQVRWLLKRSLPERTRTRGFVLALRVTGWVVCSVVTFAVTVGVVGLWLVGVMDSRGGWF